MMWKLKNLLAKMVSPYTWGDHYKVDWELDRELLLLIKSGEKVQFTDLDCEFVIGDMAFFCFRFPDIVVYLVYSDRFYSAASPSLLTKRKLFILAKEAVDAKKRFKVLEKL